MSRLKIIEKDNRFPFKLKTEDAQKIIDISCRSWKPTLAKEWAEDMVVKGGTTIEEGYYKQMRAACTTEQNVLFNEIFGEDSKELPYKIGDWVYVLDGYYNDTTNTLFKKASNEKDVFQISDFDVNKSNLGSKHIIALSKDGRAVYIEQYPEKFRKATKEEIEKAKYIPDGTACLVSDNNSYCLRYGYCLRYANGKGRFYYKGLKSGDVSTWDKVHILKDQTDLPEIN